MTFVDQHKDIIGLIQYLAPFNDYFEFMNKGSDDCFFILFYQVDKFLPAGSPDRLFTAFPERL